MDRGVCVRSEDAAMLLFSSPPPLHFHGKPGDLSVSTSMASLEIQILLAGPWDVALSAFHGEVPFTGGFSQARL